MTIRNFNYFLKQASISIFRNRLMSITSIITVFSSVLILAVAFAIGININNFISNMEQSFSFIAFINDDVTPEVSKAKYNELKAMDNVREVEYTTSDQALEDFASTLGDDNKEIIEGLEDDNPLPSSFTVYVDDPEKMGEVIKELESDVGEGKTFSSVKHAQAQLEVLTSVRRAVTILSVGLVSVLGFIAIIIIMNTIKIAVTSRRIEINIMKYIGATDWFIRWPFVFEGIFIGVIGSFVAVIATVILYAQAVKWLSNLMVYVAGGAQFLSATEVAFTILPVALIAGVLLGVIGSVSSLRAHLHV